MAIKTVVIGKDWLEVEKLAGETITLLSVGSPNGYSEVFVGLNPTQEDKGMPVRAFESIRMKNPTEKIYARNIFKDGSMIITDSLLGGILDGGDTDVVNQLREDLDVLEDEVIATEEDVTVSRDDITILQDTLSVVKTDVDNGKIVSDENAVKISLHSVEIDDLKSTVDGVDLGTVSEITPLFVDVNNGQIQSFVGGASSVEGKLYKNEKGVWYCDSPNTDENIDPSSPNWLDFSIMGRFELLQKRAQYLFYMDKITLTDSFLTVDHFLPIGDLSENKDPIPSHSLDGVVFKIMYEGENITADAENPIHIAFIDINGNIIGAPLPLKHTDLNVGGFVDYEGIMVTGTMLTVVKPSGRDYLVKM